MTKAKLPKWVAPWLIDKISNAGSASTAVQRDQWPFWAKALARFAKPEDKGIGDVVRRMIGEENSEAFKKWFKATTGKDCGCNGRQRRWNIEYPLNSKAT